MDELTKTDKPEAPAPKKRGRKRKSEITVRQLEEIIIETNAPEETISRRGRPRKKVNYYELANPDNLDFAPPEQKLRYFTLDDDFKIGKKKSVERSISPETKVLKQEDGELISNNSEAENATNGSSLDDTSTPNSKDKRYNYTGETVKMMNTLFSMFSSPTEEKTMDNEDSSTNNASNGNDVTLMNSVTKRPYKKHKKRTQEEFDDGNGNITCAICNTSLDKNLWNHHKQRYHNNLAWRVGDPPLDLNDQSFVMHTLNNLYKKKKPLYCDKCGEVKKSVVGFLSHRSQCLKSGEQLESVKISCEVCGRKMLPVSLSTHMKMLHGSPKEKEEVHEKPNREVVKPFPSKRSAAKKAMKIIENVTKNDNKDQYFSSNLDFGAQDFTKELMQKELDETQFFECKFKCNCITTNMEDALKHLEECTERPAEGFICKQCLAVAERLEDIIYHIEFTHDINIMVDGDSSYMEKENSRMPVFLHSATKKSEKVLFPFAFDWTLKFCQENFAPLIHEDLPFSDANWPLLPPEMVGRYLPKLNESCEVSRLQVKSFTNPFKNDYAFRKYKLFESEIHDDHKITLFCGGPVSAMAWLPTPYTSLDENQILAVSVLNSPDEKHETNENCDKESAVQFWSFGKLENREASMKTPELIYGLGLDYGPVWHLEWCPSGCYNFEEGKVGRMGLLAIAGSDPVVFIYSVPFPTEGKIGLYHKPTPVMKLLLQRPGSALLGGYTYHPTKISWSKASGHGFIAVGYTNGFIALFNIKSNSLILKYRDADGIACILPKKCFQGHSHAVTALALYHLNGGCRWLMSGSVDRAVNLWDLDNHSYPFSSMKKNLVTDGFWLTHWISCATGGDEGSTSSYVTTMLKQARDFLSMPGATVACSHSTISSISGSDWLNGLLHANTVGEIIALFPHQILYLPEHHKNFKSKRMLFGYTHLIEKTKTPEERAADAKVRQKTLQNLLTKKLSVGVKLGKIKSDIDCRNLFVDEPILYEEAQQRYALLFCDNKLESYEDFPKTTSNQLTILSKEYQATAPNRYPLNTINKIVFNPNRQASLYYATGYQAGFVRVSWLQFLKDDQQIK